MWKKKTDKMWKESQKVEGTERNVERKTNTAVPTWKL